ncbi:DUF6551 family protein [Novosphingobium sp. ST904]|uniref:DUF6551 family protein n=1 Tax=Novosphingobium sp. ST904 TaxID=1684385 RepID=UPI0006C8DCD5|nr:DUF6551 family protein [Novosphingobium sp. ST904]KPH67531.1 hypothetical protein ADT71_02195 [Novosphingobium sp. ST904]TCM30034.1 hypothetical protein EDF59_12761 [Novosphingobium sp. ST904]
MALETGPQKGAPPTLEWIGINTLNVDEAYQRATDGANSRRIIIGMVKEWDWALCQPLVVSRRADGSLFILDGQHRKAGAVERGDIPHLPCVVLTGRDTSAEAATFVALNTKRQKLSQADIFNGMLAAGDEEAKAMQAMLQQTGWRQRSHSTTSAFVAGDLACAPMLTRSLKAFGEAPVRNALTALREAYLQTPVRNAATLLKALMPIYRDGDLDGGDPDLFIQTLSEAEPADWELHGMDHRRKHPVLSRIEAISGSMLEAYREMSKGEAA